MGGFSRDWVKGRFAPGYRDYLSGAAKSGSGLGSSERKVHLFSKVVQRRSGIATEHEKTPQLRRVFSQIVPSTAKQMVCPSGTTYYVGRETMSKHLNLRSKRDFFSFSVSSHEGRLP